MIVERQNNRLMKKYIAIIFIFIFCLLVGCTQPLKTYTITYDLDGGVCDGLVESYQEGEIVILPKAAKEGYTFLGWFVENIKVEIIEEGNYSLVAKWEKYEMPTDKVTFNIYSLNDFHGSIFEDGYNAGFSKIGNYLRELDTNTSIILSAGDMFQGTAVSSMSRGAVVVDVMNYIGFDAMTIGNHEFDWGDSEIIKFVDDDKSNGEANFPLLAANIIDKRTGELVTWAKPYTVLEKCGVRIGVIGIIGEDQEGDILASYVKNYSFEDELTAIKKYTKILRTEEACDIVIVSCHSDTENINDSLAALSDEYTIDAILNGHTHQAYYGELGRETRANLPYVQSGCYGRYIGLITIEYSIKEKKVLDASASYLSALDVCKSESLQINQILSQYQEYIDIANQKLGLSGVKLTKDKGGVWAATALCDAYDCEVGVVNTGGIRSNGFPINIGDEITYGDIFEIMPFENMVRMVELKGSVIIDELIKFTNSYYLSKNVDRDKLTINGETIDRDKYYKVVTIDYLFEQESKPFLKGKNRVDTTDIFRDVLAQNVRDNVEKNGKFIWG